ncbi:MAG: hypothetical protein AAF740_06260 [Bacteroidota bacterium]
MTTKNFEQWLTEDVERAFGLKSVDNETYTPLLEWLTHKKVDSNLSEQVIKLQRLLKKNVSEWNEDELKIMFIDPLLVEADFNDLPNYKVFSQRKASIVTENVQASGKVEWMVAQGKQIPRNPFFFLHEYKSEKGSGNDPLGQLLITMVYAQQENQNDMPIYGTYILGRFWFFVLLKDQEYSVSLAFDATKDADLIAILAILEKVKKAIRQHLGLPYPAENI